MKNQLCSLIYVLFLGSLLSNLLIANTDKSINSFQPRKLVYSIGLNNFKSKTWRDLRFAGKDAKDLYSAFTSNSVGFDGGLLMTEASQRSSFVTKKQILAGFEKIKRANKFEDDTIIVYISTHGTVAYKKDGSLGRYIITGDSDPQNLAETAIDYDEFVSSFNRLKSRKKVLILAFCHSGVGKSVLTPQMKRALAQLKSPYFEEPIHERSESSVILTASGWREPALEDQKLQNDVYTYFLLKGFENDTNKDGAVSITEAHSYAAQMTYRFTQGRQRPSAIMELLGADPIIIKGRVKEPSGASLYSLMGRFSRLLVSVDGKNLGSLEKGVAVPDGKVRLTIKDPGSKKVVADRVVNFEAGREYSVSDFLSPRLPHTVVVGAKLLSF
ncbi:MAG: caspase family protein [Pseudobacteriovorax sp.]|nr:caspase family protein [Pseudobacteriovorax sp.]